MIYEIAPKDALSEIEQGSAIMIDVREADEFYESHIPYAISIPMSVFDTVFHDMKFSTDKTLIIQCPSGQRSARVCEYMQSNPEVKNKTLNLAGGILAWTEDGLVLV